MIHNISISIWFIPYHSRSYAEVVTSGCVYTETKRNETERNETKTGRPRVVSKPFTRERQIVLNRSHENGKRASRLELVRAGLAQRREVTRYLELVRAGGRKGQVFPAKCSPTRNGFHDRAPFPIVFTVFTVYTRTKTFWKRFENVWKRFENVSKHFEVRFHFVPLRYRFRALSCKR